MCGNRKTEILNKVGHAIQVLITQLRIKEIPSKSLYSLGLGLGLGWIYGPGIVSIYHVMELLVGYKWGRIRPSRLIT